MKKKYKLSTGLWEVKKQPMFSNDKDAWEYLRKLLPNKYARLYRQEAVNVPIVNRAQYVKKYNAKYTTQKIGKENKQIYWLPVLDGITSHCYRAVK